ncbi:hypothetical protein [Microcystis aeruginosa]|uniref:DUF4926 domain-containing protein n=1 Tax=Microcystis aeruginosa NIES-2521 TaxID=2303983 RepID=A0A5A5RTK0_MICAE|nr:hypothetical protein [Microcystis aeruginosa]GCA79863.1 hypothetical protein MiTs_01862 [Microcystis aeruginosa NIES-2521]
MILDIGSLVLVRYPNYAAGRLGYVEGRETGGRWLIRLNPLDKERQTLLLSLEEIDFEVLRSPPN